MVNLKRILTRIESEQRELKERSVFIPSQLSTSVKKQERREIGKEQRELSGKRKEVKKGIKKQEEKERKRKELSKKISKFLRKKVVSRRILKKSQPTIVIKQQDVPSILGEQNRFFKDEVEEAEMALFFR